jgi:hypothetical protein
MASLGEETGASYRVGVVGKLKQLARFTQNEVFPPLENGCTRKENHGPISSKVRDAAILNRILAK